MIATPTALARPEPLVPSAVLGMAILIATEVMFFAALVSAFVVLRAQATEWPPEGQPRLPMLVTGVNTAVLLASGVALERAARALRGGRAGARRALGATAVLGAGFLAVQGFEWTRLIGFGLTADSSLYGASFYTIVGAHGVHVAAALLLLLARSRAALRAAGGPQAQTALAPARMFWIFVVALWPVLYGLVYFG